MRKSRLLQLLLILPCTLALSGCFLKKLIIPEEEIVVDLPKIETVSSLKINLQGKTEKSLYPTLSNNSITNPEFSYVSSDTSIASVSSSGVVTGLKEGKTYITITLKSNTDVKTKVEVNVVDNPLEHYDYTIMLYMCGSDLEYNADKEDGERDGFFTEDIKEILSVYGLSDSVKIIIETGGTTLWSMESQFLEGATRISSTNLQRWEVNNQTHKLQFVETLPTNYMASETSFSEFLSWGLDDYEADQMGVIISGHGGGIAGCAYDDNYKVKVGTQFWQRNLRTFEVANAAKKALSNSNKDKFTWIGYDCCLMQCADIATINADYFDYMVASQENEDAIGWNHDIYLSALADNSKIAPEVFLQGICDSFLLDKHRESEFGEEACYQTLSVLDLSKVDGLVTAFNSFSKALGTNFASYKLAEEAYKSSLNSFAFGEAIFGLTDFASYMKQFNNTEVVQSVLDAVDDVVAYSVNCSKYKSSPCGLNLFFPKCYDKDYILQVGKEDYSNNLSTKFTSWQSMCVKHGDFGWNTI